MIMKSLNFNKIILYINTIKYLKCNQIFFQIYYRIKRIFISCFPLFYLKTITPKKYTLPRPLHLIGNGITSSKYHLEDIINNKFVFLNIEKFFLNSIDWHREDLNEGTRLWKLNLHYHEYLVELALEFDKTKDVRYLSYITNNIEDWIIKNPLGTNKFHLDNWNSYAISNRIISWVKVYSLIEKEINDSFKKKMITSFLQQASYLSKNIEYNIRGNHIIENGFATLFAAYFLDNNYLYSKSKDILIKELNEQICDDGGHFELSPMYHQHILNRMLDCYNMMKFNEFFDDDNFKRFIKKKLKSLLGWLKNITFSNGDIPLFNDCANNVYPNSSELFKYAKSLGLKADNLKLSDSGYRRVNFEKYESIIDIGKLGPDYIPGHAHNDALSFVININYNPFIIDTGTSIYNNSKRRMLEKSTCSHNTVKVGEFEQSQIWSSFRMGNRIYPHIIKDDNCNIIASISYPQKKIHTREFDFQKNKIQIIDTINSNIDCTAYLHFHPAITIILKDNIIQTNLGTISIKNANSVVIEDFKYAPEFNVLKRSKKAIINFEKKLHLIIDVK